MTWARERRSPHVAGSEDSGLGRLAANNTTGPVELVLSRLQGVRAAGRGWTAKCPAHADRTASLSVTSGSDGRCLLHCFALCEASAVLEAIGLQLADLYERRLSPLTPEHRRELKQFGQIAAWRAAVNCLTLEVSVAHIAASDVLNGKPLTREDHARLATAVDRIVDAKAVLIGH